MTNHTILTAIGCTVAASGLAHSANTLYSSDVDFNKGTGNGSNEISVAGWAGFSGRGDEGPSDPAVNTTGTSLGQANRIGLYDGSNGTVDEYLFFQKAGSGSESIDFFVHTSTGSSFSSFSPDDYSAGLTATWRKNGDAYDGFYVSVLVDGTWYASTTSNSGSLGNPVFDFLTGDWVQVFDDLSAPLTLGSTTTDSATLFAGSTIDGFGYFLENLDQVSTGNKTLRIDNIVITGVPEPSSALICLGGALIFLNRRRG